MKNNVGKWKAALQAVYIAVFQQKEDGDVGKLPPTAKAHEVYNALIDDHTAVKEQEMLVNSNDYARTYTVRFHDNEISSSDNATARRHYPGYPILAAWMKLGTPSVNWNIPPAFVEINWKKHNTRHKNRYEEVIEELLSEYEEQGYAYEDTHGCTQETLETVAKFSYTIEGNRTPMIRK